MKLLQFFFCLERYGKKKGFMDKMFKSTSIAQELKSHWQSWSSDRTGGRGGLAWTTWGRRTSSYFSAHNVHAAGELACFGHVSYPESAAFNYMLGLL